MSAYPQQQVSALDIIPELRRVRARFKCHMFRSHVQFTLGLKLPYKIFTNEIKSQYRAQRLKR